MLLLGGGRAGNCYLCHDDLQRRMESEPHVHGPAAKQCVACHDPHTSEFANQLVAPISQTCTTACHDHKNIAARLDGLTHPHDAVTKGKQCANCHESHSAPEPVLLGERMDRVCLRCHDKPVKARDGHDIPDMRPVLTEAKFPHGPVRDGQCSACHDAHGSDVPAMLTAPYPQTFYARFDIANMALCFTCHIKQMALTETTDRLTNFRNGEINLHFVHVNRESKGRTCRTCHAVHGSDLPKHMASEVPFEGSNWSMPIRFEKTDTGGSCSPGCHKPLGYDRKKPRPRPKKELEEPTTKGSP
jgi:predicted CXXCH cytochrome family protein